MDDFINLIQDMYELSDDEEENCELIALMITLLLKVNISDDNKKEIEKIINGIISHNDSSNVFEKNMLEDLKNIIMGLTPNVTIWESIMAYYK